MINIDFNALLQKITNLSVEYFPKLILALLTLIVGLWGIKIIVKALNKALTVKKVDVSLHEFLKSTVNILLKVLLFVSVASIVGIKTTSFVAIIGAAGLAVGLALQGALANFAGGVLILIFKPFKVGDYIEASGHAGVVNSIQVFSTTLLTPDNKKIVIPNGNLSNNSVVNYSAEKTRRVDFTFGIGYEDDIKKAKEVLLKVVSDNEFVLKEPEPFIGVSELADSSVNFAVRVWVNSENYWNVYFNVMENVKIAFDKESISIPYPQMDVHTYKN